VLEIYVVCLCGNIVYLRRRCPVWPSVRATVTLTIHLLPHTDKVLSYHAMWKVFAVYASSFRQSTSHLWIHSQYLLLKLFTNNNWRAWINLQISKGYSHLE